MKKFVKSLLIVLMIFVGSMSLTNKSYSQSGFSNTYAYSMSYGENNTFVSGYMNPWGHYCERWKKMIWTRYQGYHQVRVWNYTTGMWHTEWRTGWYYTYRWHYYTLCD